MLHTESNESSEIDLLTQFRHHNPHQFLGLHHTPSGQVIRLWRPGADKIYLEVLGQVVEADKIGERGLFEFVPKSKIGAKGYRVYHQSGLLSHDPYSFLPSIGEIDAFLFNKGCHYELHKMLGANIKQVEGIIGTQFAVWAPNASSVFLVCDSNHWDGRQYPMRSLGGSGVWELFIPGIKEGERYKYEIHSREGFLRVKSDPVAFYSELRPSTASIVYDLNAYEWKDEQWVKGRSEKSLNTPMSVYEVHLASWRKYESEFPNYRTVAIDLAKYCKEMGFTHIELLPIMEHPLDESWGYQVTGFFSVTSRYGTPSDFQFFVDHMHSQGIGVILDWVPAHFPTDDYSLNRFDGTALYEHEDPRKGIHPHWNTAIFNYGRKEVANFLIASALFWIEKMHVDGLRVDAVASMVYLDYGRKAGEWIPNPDGSNFNTDAIEFLKHLNSIVHERFPGSLLIAEESSSYCGVTHKEGLGFDLKWNMGWMNDTLRYFSQDPFYRKYHQQQLTFSLLYAFSEKFMGVFSHDEVVHGKGSLLNKMPGPEWQKFANLRLLYSYLISHPGKKLSFMGNEMGSSSEWNCKGTLDWHLLQYPLHRGFHDMVRDLNHFYLENPAFWENDFSWHGFEWIDFSDTEKSITAYLRKGSSQRLAMIHNFTPETHQNYRIKIAKLQSIQEVFNTDHSKYGGSHQLNETISFNEDGFSVAIAPMATMIFDLTFCS